MNQADEASAVSVGDERGMHSFLWQFLAFGAFFVIQNAAEDTILGALHFEYVQQKLYFEFSIHLSRIVARDPFSVAYIF